MKEELLKISNGTLTYHNHRLIENLNLQLFKSEVHGISLDNTDVKNALLKILCGEGSLGYGKIYYEEEAMKQNDIAKFLKRDVVLIDHTSRLVSNFKIYENMLFHRFHFLYLNPKHYYRIARDLFQHFSIDIPLNKAVKNLSIYECIIIELITAFALERKLVILSNIAGILNSYEMNSVFQLILQLKGKGMSFLILRNFEDINYEHIDRLTVIKGGRTIGVFDPKTTDKEKLYRAFDLKLELSSNSPAGKTPREPGQAVLSFRNVSDQVLKQVSFHIHKGEILRILYADEASANRFISILKGEATKTSGEIYMDGLPYAPLQNYYATKNEICFIDENPVEKLLFKHLSVLENLSYPLSTKVKGYWLKRNYRKSIALKVRPVINPEMLKKPLKALMQDDLQKIVYCKFLLYNPKLVICIKPFSVADAQNILTEKMILMLAENGISVLVITSGWPDLSSITGRILYLSHGVLKEHI